MSRLPERQADQQLRALLDRETVLENRVAEDDIRYSGLKDLDEFLELAATKLEIANHLLAHFDPIRSPAEERERTARLIRQRSADAMAMMEQLRGLNISEDQKNLMPETPAYARVAEQFQAFILRGGGVFFEAKTENVRKLKVVSRALNDCLRKFVAPDDRYVQTFKTERLPGPLRSLVNFLLPILAPEGQKDPPYGIEEGEELELTSERMKMPLSQAILYLESEVLPELQEELRKNPGSRNIQRQIASVRDRLREYRGITFRLRATPINLEKGFYTDWLSQYTAEGELLVTVPLAVRYGSGTNLDRLREMVQTELVRRLAGKGICPSIDRDHRYRKSLESGLRGSSRLPSFKLDVRRGFQDLRKLYPALKCLEDRRELQRLIDLVSSSGRKGSQRLIEAMIRSGTAELRSLPRL
jgi:hypothetical protein